VSTYGANPALPADGELDVLGDGEALAVGDAEADADALGAAVALAVAAGLVGVPAPPAWPVELVTKPTVTEPPALTVASQLSLVTVTWPPLTAALPFHRLDSDVPRGNVKARVHPDASAVPLLVMVYWPV
jgi:hypothetical protein